MNDIDTAAIRAAVQMQAASPVLMLRESALALCDALDAARAERDEMRHDCRNLLGCPAPTWKARAVAAEARVNAALAWEEDCDYHTEMQIITWIERRLLGDPE